MQWPSSHKSSQIPCSTLSLNEIWHKATKMRWQKSPIETSQFPFDPVWAFLNLQGASLDLRETLDMTMKPPD